MSKTLTDIHVMTLNLTSDNQCPENFLFNFRGILITLPNDVAQHHIRHHDKYPEYRSFPRPVAGNLSLSNNDNNHPH